nr:uncharacterized protein LOC123765243 isoform X3 [Procambarus clarkii]XP_045609723.1 uncharacterized protein LOC123765243 isoform X3 [Procambarus clarkii]
MSGRSSNCREGVKRKKVVLTIKDKLRVIELCENGRSTRSVAKEFDIGTSTVSDIKKQKYKLMKYITSSESGGAGGRWCNRKTVKLGRHAQLDQTVYTWLVQHCAAGATVSGSEIRNAASMFADSLGIQDFRATDGWVAGFKGRHNIVKKRNIGPDQGQTRTTTWTTQSPPSSPAVVNPKDVTRKDLVHNRPEAQCGNMGNAPRHQTLLDRFVVRSPSRVSTKCSSFGHSRVMKRQFLDAKGADISEDMNISIGDDLIEVKDEPIELDDWPDKCVRKSDESNTQDPAHKDSSGHIHNNSMDLSCKKSNFFQMRRCQVLIDKSTIRAFEKLEEMRRAAVEKTSSDVKSLGGECFREMERALYLWIKDQQEKNIPVNGTIICKKATKIQAGIDKKMGASGTSFYASSGWLSSFKKRHGLHNRILGKSTGTDIAATSSHPDADYLKASFHPATHASASSHPHADYSREPSHPASNPASASSHPHTDYSREPSRPATNSASASSHPHADYSTTSHSATNHTSASSHPATNSTGSSSHPATNSTGSSSHPATNSTGSSSHPATNSTGSSSHPATNSTGSSSHPATNSTGSSSHPATNSTGSSSHPASNSTASSSHPATNSTGSSSHPASNSTGSLSHPATNSTGSSSHPATNSTGSSSHPATNSTGSSSHPATNSTGSSSHPASNSAESFSHPATNHAGSSSSPAANHSDQLFHLAMGHTSASPHLGTHHSSASPYKAINNNAALLYPAEFAAIIREGNYCPEQVFNAGETGLFWKRLPSKTFLMKEEKATLGFKASKDRLSLLFCSNAAGDFKLPPVLVYRSHRPRALKNVTRLPVVWRANNKAWVTSTIFADWYQHNFIPAVDKYLRSKNLPSKAILFVDSAPSHPQALRGTADSDGYRLEFFPPNTSSLLQPLDQGVIAQIKKLYTKQVLWEMFLYTEGKGKSREKVVEFWKKFNMRNAVSIITDIWENIDPTCLKDAWENLWPEIMPDFLGFPDTQVEVRSIMEIANSIPGQGFGDLVAEDIVKHLESHRNIMTPEDVLELTTEEADEGQDDDSEDNPITQIPLSVMRQFVNHMISGIEIADSDPNFKRASEAIRLIRKVCEVYVRPTSARSHKIEITNTIKSD